MHLDWTLNHPKMTVEHLGFIPTFLSLADPRPAKEQFDTGYVGGWTPFKGFRMSEDRTLTYPGDPPMKPLAETNFRDEKIYVYQSAWVAVVQPDGSHEICRMD